jgi:Domain of unknown function (DUF4158)
LKRQWDAEELVENFTLLPSEMALLLNKSEENRLGFAVLLKFFQMEAKFPRTKQEVPKQIVSYIARLLEVSPKQYAEYSFNGRSIERHRAEIREFFGFREFNPQDKKELKGISILATQPGWSMPLDKALRATLANPGTPAIVELCQLEY